MSLCEKVLDLAPPMDEVSTFLSFLILLSLEFSDEDLILLLIIQCECFWKKEDFKIWRIKVISGLTEKVVNFRDEIKRWQNVFGNQKDIMGNILLNKSWLDYVVELKKNSNSKLLAVSTLGGWDMIFDLNIIWSPHYILAHIHQCNCNYSKTEELVPATQSTTEFQPEAKWHPETPPRVRGRSTVSIKHSKINIQQYMSQKIWVKRRTLGITNNSSRGQIKPSNIHETLLSLSNWTPVILLFPETNTAAASHTSKTARFCFYRADIKWSHAYKQRIKHHMGFHSCE